MVKGCDYVLSHCRGVGGETILDFCIQILDEADTKLAYQTCSIIYFYFFTFLV